VNGEHVLVMRGGMAVDLSDVRAVVEAMEQNEEDELYMLQWTEMLSWLRMGGGGGGGGGRGGGGGGSAGT